MYNAYRYVKFMDIITTIIYVILFIIMMVFVFAIGMLKQFMPRREVLLVILVAFLIGSIGGAFFLEPIYNELPSVASTVEKNLPNNQETLYLDLSSSVDLDRLRNNLTNTEGFISFDEKSVSIPLWTFDEKEHAYFERVVGNIDLNYKDYNVTSNRVEITLEDNYTSTEALKSFSNWYKIVYGDSISYAEVEAVLVVDAYAFDDFQKILLDNGIVASKIEGPIQDTLNNTNSSMLNNIEFTLICGGIGVVVAVLGIYVDSVVPAFRRIKKVFTSRRKR